MGFENVELIYLTWDTAHWRHHVNMCWTFGLHNRRWISLLTQQLLASEELWYMVSYVRKVGKCAVM
jgi:hypothetical protein